MKKQFEGLLKDEDGQGLMTYGLLIFFVAIAVISAVGLINGDFVEIYQKLSTNNI